MQQEISPITHSKAVAERFTDRYLLRELSAAETEEFERHYFECAECAEAVETGETFILNAREVLGDVAVAEPERSFLKRIGIRWTWGGMLIPATALALAVIAIYQGAVVIPRLSLPRVLPAFQLLGASRGLEEARLIPAGVTAFAISADVPPDAHSAKYVCELKTGGRTVFTLDAAPPSPGQPITILVPTKGLGSGSYQLTISGGSEKVFDASFEVRFQ
jgi:hypothetical protein